MDDDRLETTRKPADGVRFVGLDDMATPFTGRPEHREAAVGSDLRATQEDVRDGRFEQAGLGPQPIDDLAKPFSDKADDPDERACDAIKRGIVSDSIHKHFGEYLSARAPEGCSIDLESEEVYSRQLRAEVPRVGPNGRPPTGAEIPGFYRDGTAHILRDARQSYHIAAHEVLHHCSSPEVRRQLGWGLNEGMTERFAHDAAPIFARDLEIRQNGPDGSVDWNDRTPVFYPDESRIVEMMAAAVGDAPIKEAYFRGNVAALRTEFDAARGSGALDRLSSYVEARNWSQAEQLLRRPSRPG